VGAFHSRASFWLDQGIFDNLTSFEDFERRVDRIFEEKDRGDIFEIFIEGYLETQPIAQCVKHWVVGQIPLILREKYRLPRDPTGIDGIYETHDGQHVAYQVKYRRSRELTYTEVSPFFGITEKFTEKFTDRVIFPHCRTRRL
jgi:predicted helicase